MKIIQIKKLILMCILVEIFFLIIPTAYAHSYQWVEYGPNNQLIIKSVTDTNSHQCPIVKIQYDLHIQKIKMTQRDVPENDFPISICQAVLPVNTTAASINNKKLYLPKRDPQKIVIIGDTGCRMQKGIVPQNCSNSNKWPFRLISTSAAQFKPDLVIHVGNYLYRESKGLSSGDNWATWKANFFQPAKPLLETAPWVFVRGNHELCDRGGIGWEALLDPFSFKHCYNHSPLYNVKLGDTNLFIMDSASASDILSPASEVSWYSNYLRQIAFSKAKYNWIITHKPFWFVYDGGSTKTSQSNFTNTLQSTWLNVNPHNVELFISGHLHRFEVVNFDKSRPPQVIVGTGGAHLDKSFSRTDLKGLNIAGLPVNNGLSLTYFGYMTLEKSAIGWDAQMRNPYGKIFASCKFNHQTFTCK